MDALFRIGGAVRRDKAVAAWFALTDPFRQMVKPWFAAMRAAGEDVREALHDGHPVAAVGDAPFAYVDAFRAHASVGFFRGASLPDPAGLLEGTGRRMRHVKLVPGKATDDEALAALIAAAHADMRACIAALSPAGRGPSAGRNGATAAPRRPRG